ncbi:copper chaperone [Fibrella sp. ES10-3-2-2]|nr:hypothetical protein A6C57_22985 [Fibrella sp. ES10-3-2-2]
METLHFKTNILSSEAIATVSPELNGIEQIDGWNIDQTTEASLLTVQTTDNRIAGLVIHVVQNAGYEAELVTLH